MILPIVAYGDAILRKRGENIDKKYPELQKLIDDMFETMENARGVGLAAPQINKSIRLFVVDSTRMSDDDEGEVGSPDGIREVFLNPKLFDETGKEWAYEEGCLSIPGVRENVTRLDTISIQYYDRNFDFHEKTFDGLTARVIQHEYDHIEGKLFIDHLKPLKRTLLKGKLDNISKGKVSVDYKMRFPKK
ncbi:MAG: peptide deformylase [Chitinophagales bacterium]|nr:peptide deformylase [Chitinophagales bacterium]MCO5280257.1 peptide deformylase [Chitinophagales bacterium]OJV26416.1 MAG: peptide deformylase [Bacteroidetes bacterium 37-13]HRP39426.1 peptide deformylase [Chitinophagales bacterium]